MTSRIYIPLLLLFFVSGSSSLMFETLWQRLMVLVFGASAPATAAILIAFFLGLGLGSFIGGRILERFDRALLFYACVEFWIGLWSLAVPALLGAMGLLLIEFGDSNQITALPYLVRLLLAIAMVLPATLGMGATIPVMNRLIHEHGRGIGYSTALAYGINTLGAVAGLLADRHLPDPLARRTELTLRRIGFELVRRCHQHRACPLLTQTKQRTSRCTRIHPGSADATITCRQQNHPPASAFLHRLRLPRTQLRNRLAAHCSRCSPLPARPPSRSCSPST